MAKKVKSTLKLNKAEIESKIVEIMKLKEDRDKADKRIKELQASIESQFTLDAKEREFIYGDTVYAEKVPVEGGQNNYDVTKLKTFLKGIRGAMTKVVKKVEVINVAALDELVKTGKLPEAVLKTCRQPKWTYKTLFKRNENATSEVAEKQKVV